MLSFKKALFNSPACSSLFCSCVFENHLSFGLFYQHRFNLFFFSFSLFAWGQKVNGGFYQTKPKAAKKAFNSTNWTHTQRSCQTKLLSHVKDQSGGRKMQTPLLSVYANRRGKEGRKQGHWAAQREEIVLWCKQRKPKLRGLLSQPNQVQ